MISRFHARALAEIPGVQLLGCYSRSWESALQLAGETGCQPCRHLQELLALPDLQVVNICTPSGDHLAPALAAIDAGKHVLVEKPLEITVERCDRIIQAALRKNVLVSTIFPARFQGCWQVVQRAVAEGRFGKLTLGNAYVKWFRTQEYYDSGAWRGTWGLDGGGVLMNQAIHTIDLLLWLLGEVQTVTAFTATRAHERIEVEDVAVAALSFQNGALGSIEATTGSFPGQSKRIEIHGSQGSVAVEDDRIVSWQFDRPDSRDEYVRTNFCRDEKSAAGAADPRAISHAGHADQFRDFLGALQAGRPPAIGGHDGRRSVALIQAIYRSARTRETIQI